MGFLPQRYSYKKVTWRFAVIIIDILCIPLSFFIPKKKFSAIHLIKGSRVLISHFGGIGDIILAEPLVRALKRRFPGCAIDMGVRAEVADTCLLLPGVDRVITLPLAKNYLAAWLHFGFSFCKKIKHTYAMGFDLKGDPFVIACMFGAGIPFRLGFDSGGLSALLHHSNSPREDISKAQASLELADFYNTSKDDIEPQLTLNQTKIKTLKNEKPLIVFHQGAGEDSKLWPRQSWEELCTLLSLEYRVEEIKIGEGSILQAAARINQADAYIGLDTGLTHIASALHRPTLCLFSTSHNPIVWGPARARILLFAPYSVDLLPQVVYDELKTIV